jgi:hypothetical protein
VKIRLHQDRPRQRLSISTDPAFALVDEALTVPGHAEALRAANLPRWEVAAAAEACGRRPTRS